MNKEPDGQTTLCGEPITQAEARALKLFLAVLRTSTDAKALITTGWAQYKYSEDKIPPRPFTNLSAVPDMDAPIKRCRVFTIGRRDKN